LGQELKAEEPAERERDLALAIAIDVLPVNCHLRHVVNNALNHRGDLR
jgi:hypothetical protein